MNLSSKQMLARLLWILAMAQWGINAYGQYGNVWAFGESAGIDFNTTPPTTIKTSIITREGCASICDGLGNLLFYTDGTTIWDRSHRPMPNGTDLSGTGISDITSSTSQGALIVPIPARPSEYYVFSLTSWESAASGNRGKLYYCLVDMKRNGGAGDVVPGTKSKLLASDLDEHMTAVSGKNCNIWLLVCSYQSLQARSYNITYEGVDTTPVRSTILPGGDRFRPGGGGPGMMDVSPDRTKVVLTNGNLVMYDLDLARGTINNPLVLAKYSYGNLFYGVAFSPDNTKLYATTGDDGTLYQFDLSLSDRQQIVASRMLIGRGLFFAVKRAPDGKLYIARYADKGLAVINQPNLAGLACDYQFGGFVLAGRSTLGLPNEATIVDNRKNYTSRYDTICGDSFVLRALVSGGWAYEWQDGRRADDFTVHMSGTYWVSYQDYTSACADYVDTFHVVLNKSIRINTTTVADAMCKADTIILRAKVANATNYFWEDQSSGPQKIARQAGIYWVNYQIDSVCAIYFSDTFDVRYKNYQLSFAGDSLYCAGQPVNFKNTSDPPFNRFEWYYGDGLGSTVRSPQHSYSQAGEYMIRLLGWINDKCADSVAKYIIVDSMFPVRFRTDREIICQGEMIRFFPETDVNMTALYWNYDADHHLVSVDKLPTQHAFPKPGIYPIALRAINRVCPETQFVDTIEVQTLPVIYLGPDSSLCWQGQPILLENKVALPARKNKYLWNTGATTASIQALHPGTYWLRVTTDSLGCTHTETIDIGRDCYMDIPNAFTPNGDGCNDYFFPRQMLAASLSQFAMRIYNRWGQVVFETHSVNGKGWDGCFNNNILSQGVYIYRIEARSQKGGTLYYEGNVTLIR